ncbi:MAG: response regulator [Sphingomonas sp.]
MLGGHTILVVEDEPIVALNLAFAIEDMGWRVAGPVATVAEAFELVPLIHASGAVLDARLADRDVTPLAIDLVERGIPFIIHSGTGLPDALAKTHPHLPVIMKPASSQSVLDELKVLMDEAA